MGCAENVNVREVTGIYTANFAPGMTIELLTNNLYVYKVQQNGTVITSTNKWEFENWDGRSIISLYNFSEGLAETGVTNAIWPATIERSGRRLRVVYDRDSNQFFLKRNE